MNIMTPPHCLPRPVILHDHPATSPHPLELPVPPGTTVTLPDEYGNARQFAVYYQMYPMPHDQAISYVDYFHRNLGAAPTVTTNTLAAWIVGGDASSGDFHN